MSEELLHDNLLPEEKDGLRFREQWEKENKVELEFGLYPYDEAEKVKEYIEHLESRLSRCEGAIQEHILDNDIFIQEFQDKVRKQAGMEEK